MHIDAYTYMRVNICVCVPFSLSPPLSLCRSVWAVTSRVVFNMSQLPNLALVDHDHPKMLKSPVQNEETAHRSVFHSCLARGCSS